VACWDTGYDEAALVTEGFAIGDGISFTREPPGGVHDLALVSVPARTSLFTSHDLRSRWVFDAELLARLVDGAPGAEPIPARRILEVPLRAWRDVGGSKLRAGGALWAGVELLRLLAARWLRRGARAVAAPPPEAYQVGARRRTVGKG
jgi:hypothetical protein